MMKRNNRSVVTIGVFDGVHVGHRAVIKKVVQRARHIGATSIVLTFDPHPLKIFNRAHEAPSLISLKHRMRLIKDLGVDRIMVMKFDKKLSETDPGIFVKKILVKELGAAQIFVGEDFCFGRGAGADVETLKNIAKISGVKVYAVKAVRMGSNIVSSSLIRKLVISGKIKEASRLLGRPFAILGTVVSGAKLARVLGYPTANINPHHEAIPPSGVYAVRVKYRNKILKGVMNIGVKPTFYDHGRDTEPSIEVHIFNFRGSVYGKDLEIVFVKRIRSEKKFKTIDSLINQVMKDVKEARSLLA